MFRQYSGDVLRNRDAGLRHITSISNFPGCRSAGFWISVGADLATDRSTDARPNMQHSGTAV
jgi:hypothetical protein